jgi:hypothetical protein
MAQSIKKRRVGKPKKNRKNILKKLRLVESNISILKSINI